MDKGIPLSQLLSWITSINLNWWNVKTINDWNNVWFMQGQSQGRAFVGRASQTSYCAPHFPSSPLLYSAHKKAIARFSERQQLHAITDCMLPTWTPTPTHTHTHTTWFVPPPRNSNAPLMEVPWHRLWVYVCLSSLLYEWYSGNWHIINCSTEAIKYIFCLILW